MIRKPPSPLSAHVGYWLRLVSNHVSQSFARRLEDHGVTVAEWVLLRHLHDGDALAPSRLATLTGLTRGAVSKLEERLAARDLVRRAPDPDDGRSHRLALTPGGRALVPRLAALADANDDECFDALPTRDRDALVRILRAVADARGLRGDPTE